MLDSATLSFCRPLHCYSRAHAEPVRNHNDARVALMTLTIVTGAALWLIVYSGMVSDLAS
jgi:hypothetical protein